ncbi:MAG: M48 family metallopeptidase [Nitrospirota bacterium]
MADFNRSIYDQMRANRWRTAYMFMIFPIIIIGLTYIAFLLTGLFDSNYSISAIDLANEMMSTIGFWVLLAVVVWSFISYFLGSRMIMAFAGAKPIEKKDDPRLYRIVENVSIAAGLPKTPDIYIINDSSLNAFATGTNPKNSKVAISKGLLDKLEKDELEGVMAHEIGHILNRDIRVMLLSITLVGAIEMIGEILIRSRGGGSRNKSSGPLILIGILFLTVGVLVGTLTRLAISREREYLADATGSHLISNPLALVGALEKIAGDARIEILDTKTSMAGLCIADPSAIGHKKHTQFKMGLSDKKQDSGLMGQWKKLWSTHPPMEERIARLKGY